MTSDQLLQVPEAALRTSGSDDRYEDKVNAISGIDFKQKLPVIKDDDRDLDRHLREYEGVLSMHAYGRRAVRAIDRLILYKKTFPDGSLRAKVYNAEHKRATRKGRLPLEAQKVFEEIIAKQKRSTTS